MRGAGALWTIVVLNGAVFLLWAVAEETRSPALLEFLAAHFLVSRDHLAAGHFWTLLTAAFSHEAPLHLVLNMMVLYSFGTVLVYRWGPRAFLIFHLVAGVFSSAGHVVVGELIGRHEPALGASGAVSAALAAFTVLYPRHRILVLGLLPLPAYIGTALFVGLDVWGVLAQKAGGGLPIGHGAHLAGALFGLAFSLARKRLFPGQALRPEEAAILDALRRKVETYGVESLTPDERHFVETVLRRQGHGS